MGDTELRVDAHRRHILVAAALTAIACIYYLALLTDGDWNLFAPEQHGLIYNDVLAHLLHGDVTVNTEIASPEVFLDRGRFVVYWGIFPAFLRLPLVPFHALYDLQVSRLSCWGATCIVAGFLVATLTLVYRSAAPSKRGTRLFYILVVGTLVSGTVVTSLGSAYVYNEPIFWAVAFAVAFNYVVLRRVIFAEPLRSRDLLVLACLAGLALNCRVLEGIGLCLAMGWVFLLTLFGRGHGADAGITSATVAAGLRKVIAPALVLTVFVVLCGAVNYLRWGSPLTFANMSEHVLIAADPRRVAVLKAYGDLNPLRIPFSLVYYLLGIPVAYLLEPLFPHLNILYDNTEGPLSALVVTDSVALVLAILGIRHAFRRSAGSRPGGGPLVAGIIVSQFVAVVLLLSAEYLAMRYRMDFVPAVTFAAAIGYLSLHAGTGISTRMLRGALVLTVIATVASHDALFRYKVEIAGLKEKGRLFWQSYQCAKNPTNCSH